MDAGGEGGSAVDATQAMDALDNECGELMDETALMNCGGMPMLSDDCTELGEEFAECRDAAIAGFELSAYDKLIVQTAASACRQDSDSTKCANLTLIVDAQGCEQSDREECSVGNDDACAELQACIDER